MSEVQIIDAPDEGGLDAVDVPRLLAQAWRDRRSGLLQLSHGQSERRIVVRDGAPISIESMQGEDTFARYLEDTGRIDAEARRDVERVADERACPQASAVLALKLLDAKALYQALRGETRHRIAETFDWSAGQYRWLPATPPSDEKAGAAKPHDLLSLLQAELPRRWGTDRLFSALMNVQEICGDIAPRFRKVAEKLAGAGAPAERAIARLDGRLPLGRVLGECAGDPLAAATLWTALYTGVLRVGGSGDAPAAMDLEFEVEVTEAATGAGAAASARSDTRAAPKSDKKTEQLREEIATRLEQLDVLDHYGALGLDAGASAAEVKKAYFKAAKKYHPDALARRGLDALREDAARVFARIAEAFEVLSDPDKKAAYDAGGDEPEIDTARLAQAETSFRKGEILLKMGNFQGALEYLEPAVELWPEEPAYQSGLGWALFKQPQADAERAAEHLALAVAGAPDDAVTLLRLGLVKRALGDHALGDELIAGARAIDPSVQE